MRQEETEMSFKLRRAAAMLAVWDDGSCCPRSRPTGYTSPVFGVTVSFIYAQPRRPSSFLALPVRGRGQASESNTPLAEAELQSGPVGTLLWFLLDTCGPDWRNQGLHVAPSVPLWDSPGPIRTESPAPDAPSGPRLGGCRGDAAGLQDRVQCPDGGGESEVSGRFSSGVSLPSDGRGFHGDGSGNRGDEECS